MNQRVLLLLGLMAALFIWRRKLQKGVTMAIETVKNYDDPLRRQIVREEGLKRYAYKDNAGYWTIGIGHKIDTQREAHLLNYTQSNPAPDAVIDDLYERDISGARGAVQAMVKVPLTPNEFAALVSLVFNIGAGAFYKSTLLKLLNAGDKQGAADEILRWKNAGGQPILLARRERERELFMTA